MLNRTWSVLKLQLLVLLTLFILVGCQPTDTEATLVHPTITLKPQISVTPPATIAPVEATDTHVPVADIAIFDLLRMEAEQGVALGRDGDFQLQLLCLDDIEKGWMVCSPSVDESLQAVQVESAHNIRVLTVADKTVNLWSTDDGGSTWDVAEVGVLGRGYTDITDFQFVDTDHGWIMVVEDRGMSQAMVAIHRTTDSGVSWQKIIDPQPNMETSWPPVGMIFLDTQLGYWLEESGAAGMFILQRTQDGGVSWTEVTLPPPAGYPELFSDINQFQCTAAMPVFFGDGSGQMLVDCHITDPAAGEPGALNWLYTTPDQGYAWQLTQLPQVAATLDGGTLWGQVSELSFLDSQQGWSLVYGRYMFDDGLRAGPVMLYHSVDAGQTWTELVQMQAPGQILFVDEEQGWYLIPDPEQPGNTQLLRTRTGGGSWHELAAEVYWP